MDTGKWLRHPLDMFRRVLDKLQEVKNLLEMWV